MAAAKVAVTKNGEFYGDLLFRLFAQICSQIANYDDCPKSHIGISGFRRLRFVTISAPTLLEAVARQSAPSGSLSAAPGLQAGRCGVLNLAHFHFLSIPFYFYSQHSSSILPILNTS